ncbi:hypothetical protein D1872_336740 [compost metagenome]
MLPLHNLSSLLQSWRENLLLARSLTSLAIMPESYGIKAGCDSVRVGPLAKETLFP